MMRKILFVVATCFISTYVQAQAINEDIIKPYMANTEFGEFTFKKSSNIKLSKEEFDFRAQYRKDFLSFVNQFGNASEMEADFDEEDMSDSFIELIYNEVFVGTEGGPSPTEVAKAAGIDDARFDKVKTDGERFIKGVKEDGAGTCQLTIWTVMSEKEQVKLEFYINEQGQITEYEEIWPDF
ncbi:MAG: hypothetical protein JXR07_12785 [Reichenbachiella sp.]